MAELSDSTDPGSPYERPDLTNRFLESPFPKPKIEILIGEPQPGVPKSLLAGIALDWRRVQDEATNPNAELDLSAIPVHKPSPTVEPVATTGDLLMKYPGIERTELARMVTDAQAGARQILTELAEVLDRHKVWTPEDRQAFLDSLTVGRLLFWTDYKSGGTSSSGVDDEHRHETKELKDIRLISSRVAGGHHDMHAPVLDLDFPCRLEPSTTPGHFHLYLDREMTWENYVMLLRILAVVGILEEGYVGAAIKRRQTFVRAPWEKKLLDSDIEKLK